VGAVALQIADAVVSEINSNAALWVPQTFTAHRLWLPIVDLETAPTLAVTVIPNAIPVNERVTRALRQYHYRVDVVIDAKIASQANADLDPFALLAEQISDYFCEGNALAAFSSSPRQPAVPIAALVDPLMYPDQLDGKFVFTSVVQLTILLERKNP
jgi:hypothetical protein